MKKLSLIVCLIFIASGILLADSFTYRKTTGKEVTTTTSTIKKIPGGFLITIGNNIFETDNLYNTLLWKMKDPQSRIDITAVCKGDKVILSGQKDGKKIDQSFDLKGKKWYQAMSFGLAAFSVSKQNHIVYWVLHPNTLEGFEMEAKKERVETILVNGKKEEGQRVHVNLTGFAALFWSAEYWFDPQKPVLLRYESVEGPGNPLTVDELLSQIEEE